MHVIVGNTLILIRLMDLRVLDEAFRLPHNMVVPDVMLADDVGGYDASILVDKGARLGRLDSDGVELARGYQAAYPALSTTETFALVLTKAAGDGAILLSIEPQLSRTAESHGLMVRGLPWILDEMLRHGTADVELLRTASW